MKIINTYKWTINGSKEQTLKLNENKRGDTVVSEVYIQIPANTTLAASGVADKDQDKTNLKLLNVGTFQTVDTASSAGIYLIMAGGLEQLTLSFTGTDKEVNVKEVF